MSQAQTLLTQAQRAAACSAVRRLLYSVESGVRPLPEMLIRHRLGCLSCQAETIRQRQVLRGFSDISEVTESSPRDLTSDWVTIEQDSFEGAAPVDRRRRRSRVAIASAASIAAIGVVVVAGRRIRSIAS